MIDTLPTWLVASLGAVGGVGLAALGDLLKDLRGRRFRWDEITFDCFAQFVVAARTARDGAARYADVVRMTTDDEMRQNARREFNALHAEMRGGFDRLALVGEPAVVREAREILADTYKLRQLAENGAAPHEVEWKRIHTGVMAHQQSFLKHARRQLRVHAGFDPGDGVAPKA